MFLNRMLVRIFKHSSTSYLRPVSICHRYLSNKADAGLSNTFYYRESPLINKIEHKEIPLVLVLGWAGAIDKHVLKYAQMYENMGYHTIRLSPSVRLSIFQPNSHKEYALKLLDLIKSKSHLNQAPIVVHTFSNAGCFIYRHVSEILSESKNEYSYLKPNLKSMIYDSGPGLPSDFVRLKRAVIELVEDAVKSRILAYMITSIGLFMYHFNAKNSKPNFLDTTIDSLIRDKFELPILAFISKADDLICYKQTIEFLNERQKLLSKSKIEKVIFEDSAHCMHYLVHKEVYLDKLKKHLAESKLPSYNITHDKN